MSVVELVTDFVPSPVVETTGVKEPLKIPEPGRLEMDGVDGVNGVDEANFITETVLSVGLSTYTVLVEGLTATPEGELPTAIVEVTVLVDPSITDMALSLGSALVLAT